ncbi:MAG: restriction endonuclease subunit S, partial [Lachnospiraceae bacterium]|nr:restriction endonuclease subunit S [Lachnospiraceae bacterium]
IYLGDLSVIPIELPCMQEQKKISTFFKSLDNTIGLHQGKLSAAILASLLNFLIFFLMTRNYRRIDPRERARQARWKAATHGGFNQQRDVYQHATVRDVPKQENKGYRHKCAICGRTDVTNPELEFRYCSKCNGNYEYCNEHLFTHPHVQ